MSTLIQKYMFDRPLFYVRVVSLGIALFVVVLMLTLQIVVNVTYEEYRVMNMSVPCNQKITLEQCEILVHYLPIGLFVSLSIALFSFISVPLDVSISVCVVNASLVVWIYDLIESMEMLNVCLLVIACVCVLRSTLGLDWKFKRNNYYAIRVLFDPTRHVFMPSIVISLYPLVVTIVVFSIVIFTEACVPGVECIPLNVEMMLIQVTIMTYLVSIYVYAIAKIGYDVNISKGMECVLFTWFCFLVMYNNSLAYYYWLQKQDDVDDYFTLHKDMYHPWVVSVFQFISFICLLLVLKMLRYK